MKIFLRHCLLILTSIFVSLAPLKADHVSFKDKIKALKEKLSDKEINESNHTSSTQSGSAAIPKAVKAYFENSNPNSGCFSRRNAMSWVKKVGGVAKERYNSANKTSEKFRISSKDLEIIFYFAGQSVSDNAIVSGCWVGYFPGSGSETQIKSLISELESSLVIPKGLSYRNTGSSVLIEGEIGNVSE